MSLLPDQYPDTPGFNAQDHLSLNRLPPISQAQGLLDLQRHNESLRLQMSGLGKSIGRLKVSLDNANARAERAEASERRTIIERDRWRRLASEQEAKLKSLNLAE